MVECNLAKVEVAGSNPVSRSIFLRESLKRPLSLIVMKKIPSLVWLAILLIVMFQTSVPAGAKSQTPKVTQVTTTTSGRVDLCLGCHKERPDKAHGREVLGCAVCHMGNPLAGDMQRAHRGMVLNPGELRFVDRTCGQSGCHPKEVTWVKNSLMATNRGIISTLRFYWGETSNHNEDLSVKTLKDTGMDSPALDYYRKMCGSCHLWVERRTLPSFLIDRGGGCTACHLVEKGRAHPWIVKDIPIENCVRCHNRSGRIGLSYQGQMESEGYGTPYEGGDFSPRQYVDGRFYRVLKDDIHHRKGMICIDCHTQKEVMGDGRRRAHFEGQLEVTCKTCHGDPKTLKAISELQGANLSVSNPLAHQQVGRNTGPPRLDIVEKGGSFFLRGKQDKKLHPLDSPDPIACLQPVHHRLSCQACHSKWVPQCYGCHILQDKTKTQLDKIAIKETPGRWEEFRSFIRHTCPPLGVFDHGKYQQVVILVPG